MLVLISFGLVLVATVLLVFGLIADDGLTLIYISIACSLAAGIILVVATRVNRPRQEAIATGPAPLPPPEAAEPVATIAEEPVAADDAFAPATAPVAAVATSASVDDDLFPIADYDDLSVGEIVPLLPKLYADEIDVVAERERAGKSRRQILSKLDELRASMADAPDDLTAEEWAEQQAAAPGRTRKAAGTKKVVAAAPAKKTATPAKKAAAPAKKVATPAKKAATKKAPAKKAAAPAKKAATTAKKAAPAKKTAAKKTAAPAKKATKTTKATKKR